MNPRMPATDADMRGFPVYTYMCVKYARDYSLASLLASCASLLVVLIAAASVAASVAACAPGSVMLSSGLCSSVCCPCVGRSSKNLYS